MPELAVTLAGIIKKKNDIALGNIIGSSIFNLIFVMGVTGLVAEVPFHAEAAWLIMPFMLGGGILLTIFMRTSWELKRWEGAILCVLFIVYLGFSVAIALKVVHLDHCQGHGESVQVDKAASTGEGAQE